MSFTARYRGVCATCDNAIEPGQEVEYDGAGDLVHVLPLCVTLDDDDQAKQHPVCPRCFTHHPGEC